MSQKNSKYYAERRKKLYQTNPDYRERIKRSNRQVARRHYEVSASNRIPNFTEQFELIKPLGKLRVLIFHSGNIRGTLCFTNSELANCLSKPLYALSKWQRELKFPKPAIITFEESEGSHHAVYTFDQVKRLLTILNEHYKSKRYLCDEDQQTIKELFEAVYNESDTPFLYR